MKHGIIGTGTIGNAWAIWLSIHEKDVIVYDVNEEAAKKTGCRSVDLQTLQKEADLIWICTAEWNVDEVCEQITHTKKPVIIRSTIPPGKIEQIQQRYDIQAIAHMPEFLREKTAIQDTFNQDRFVIGTKDDGLYETIYNMVKREEKPVIRATPHEAALIKLIANSWLATQISFWNDMKRLIDTYEGCNAQAIADAVITDKRISRYGSKLTGKPFSGFCLPKDLESLRLVFLEHQLVSIILPAVNEVNEEISDD